MEATRAALVVAADEFADPKFQRLRSPGHDVEALASVLADDTIGGFAVQTVVNQPASVVQQELERFFLDRRADDLLLLYFSCHGVKDATGRLYFVTSDTTFDLLRSTGVSAAFVSEQMEYSRSKRIVVMLDCCYSGAFLKGFRARGDNSVAVDQLEGRGRAVITASRATEYAFEADELAAEDAQPSMFTGAVVEGLATGKADANGDGLITVDELYDYVYDAVRGKVAGQTPGRWIDVEGELVVARNPNPVEPAPPDPAAQVPPVRPPQPVETVGPAERVDRWAAGLALAGGLAVLLSPYFEYLKFDGSSEKLSQRSWFALGTFAFFGLTAVAAYCVLRSARSRSAGHLVLAAIVPVALGDALIALGDLVHSDAIRPGPGWALLLLGFGLIGIAGVIGAARARPAVVTAPPRIDHPDERAAVARVVAALVIGGVATIGWAKALQLTGNGLGSVASPAQDLAFRLFLIGLIVGVAGSWLATLRVSSRLLTGVALAVVGGVLLAYFTSDGVLNGGHGFMAAALAVLAVGDAVVPALAAATRPARMGAVLVGAWAGASAAWVPGSVSAGGTTLVVALLAAGGLALWLSARDRA